MPTQTKPRKLEPLTFTCLTTDCPNGLHAFGGSRKRRGSKPPGTCKKCGANLVDWQRVQQRDFQDFENTLSELKKEFIRHQYWCSVDIDPWAVNKARRLGLVGVQAAVAHRLEKYVCVEGNYRDGRQTPKRGDIIFYAQHATATCCRKCIAQWHGIPADMPVDQNGKKYLSELIMRYVTEKLPEMKNEGEYVPSIRVR
jgi:hypothetical protein